MGNSIEEAILVYTLYAYFLIAPLAGILGRAMGWEAPEAPYDYIPHYHAKRKKRGLQDAGRQSLIRRGSENLEDLLEGNAKEMSESQMNGMFTFLSFQFFFSCTEICLTATSFLISTRNYCRMVASSSQ